MRTRCTKLFPPHTLPYCPEVKKIAKSGNFDLIITSEVFSLNSLKLALCTPKNLIVWQELGKHNRIFHGLASKFWYGIVAKIGFKKALIVARSVQAREFISKYCKNVSDTIIDHGVNIEKFTPCREKDNQFAISSQLISRKHIEKINQVVEEALTEADVTLEDLDAVGVTYGPGLVGALLVGVAEAKAISYAKKLPLIGVHHIEGHVSANYIDRQARPQRAY